MTSNVSVFEIKLLTYHCQAWLGWWRGLAVTHWFRSMYTGSYSMPDPVSTWMGDHVRAGKPSRYVVSQLG